MVAVGDKATADYANARQRVLSGTVTVVVTTGGTPAFLDVTFPAGSFPAGVTAVQATAQTAAPNTTSASYTNPTATGVRLYAVRPTAGGVLVSYTVTGPDS